MRMTFLDVRVELLNQDVHPDVDVLPNPQTGANKGAPDKGHDGDLVRAAPAGAEHIPEDHLLEGQVGGQSQQNDHQNRFGLVPDPDN